MERFARLVARMLAVPVALVSLAEAGRQVFPGMVGLAEPWATSRQTPLSHSLCQHVITSGSPLVLPDARQDERTCTSLAIGDLGVVVYAGMPLTDGQGHVLGSLCAIDERPRVWSPQELADLNDLAAACSGELRLRSCPSLPGRLRMTPNGPGRPLRQTGWRRSVLMPRPGPTRPRQRWPWGALP